MMVTMKEADLIFIRDMAFIGYHNKVSCRGRVTDKLPHYAMWVHMLELLKDNGYRLFIPKIFRERYPTLVDSHIYGVCKRLRFKANIYNSGFRIEFYQNVHKVNPNGGEYDFDKYSKMPKVFKHRFNAITRKIIKELCGEFDLKFYDQSNIQYPRLTAEQMILKHFQESSFSRYGITSLDEVEGYMEDYDFRANSNSGVGDILKCGEVRRYKDWKGKMRVGKIYHNINNMWWVIRSKYKYNNICSSDIFEIQGGCP